MDISEPDHYSVVGLPITASSKEIRMAAAKLVWADLDQDRYRVAQVQEALRVLSRPAIRWRADQLLGYEPKKLTAALVRDRFSFFEIDLIGRNAFIWGALAFIVVLGWCGPFFDEGGHEFRNSTFAAASRTLVLSVAILLFYPVRYLCAMMVTARRSRSLDDGFAYSATTWICFTYGAVLPVAWFIFSVVYF